MATPNNVENGLIEAWDKLPEGMLSKSTLAFMMETCCEVGQTLDEEFDEIGIFKDAILENGNINLTEEIKEKILTSFNCITPIEEKTKEIFEKLPVGEIGNEDIDNVYNSVTLAILAQGEEEFGILHWDNFSSKILDDLLDKLKTFFGEDFYEAHKAYFNKVNDESLNYLVQNALQKETT